MRPVSVSAELALRTGKRDKLTFVSAAAEPFPAIDEATSPRPSSYSAETGSILGSLTNQRSRRGPTLFGVTLETLFRMARILDERWHLRSIWPWRMCVRKRRRDQS